MLDEKSARRLLGLNTNASRNDIERRYAIILKKYRMVSAEVRDGNETVDIDEITNAYNVLMGYVVPQTEQETKASNPLLKKIGIDEKKARNFLHYYKVHIIVGVIALIILATTIRGCVAKVNPDFNIAFLGELGFTKTDILKATIQAEIPEIKEPGFDGAFIVSGDSSGGGQQEYAMQMKAMILFAVANEDLFILDEANFEKYMDQGAFISLDEIALKLGVDKGKSKSYKMEDSAEHIYGIDVSNSEVLRKSGILGGKMIAAIPVRSELPEKGLEVIALLLK